MIGPNLSSNQLLLLVRPLRRFTLVKEAATDRPSDDLILQRTDLSILTAECTIWERLAASDQVDLAVLSSAPGGQTAISETPLKSLVDFIEMATLPAAWSLANIVPGGDNGEDAGSDMDEELSLQDCEKVVATSKALIVRAIVELSSKMDVSDRGFTWFWDTMGKWSAGTARDDLVSCAFLVFGNAAREGKAVFEFSAE